MGKIKRGKGSKRKAGATLADCTCLPLAVCAATAAPHEVTLVAPTLDSRFVDDLPQRLIGDHAYDADPLDEALLELGIELIAPHRRNWKRPKTQDGRPLRRYKRRCVGRLSASSLGSATSGAWWCAMSATRSITWASSISAAS